MTSMGRADAPCPAVVRPRAPSTRVGLLLSGSPPKSWNAPLPTCWQNGVETQRLVSQGDLWGKRGAECSTRDCENRHFSLIARKRIYSDNRYSASGDADSRERTILQPNSLLSGNLQANVGDFSLPEVKSGSAEAAFPPFLFKIPVQASRESNVE